MNFVYEAYCLVPDHKGEISLDSHARRQETYDKLDEITDEMVTDPKFVLVYDNLEARFIKRLETPDDLLGWRTGGERANAWKPGTQPVVGDKIAAAVNPTHYQGYIEEMQWIDAMSRIPSLRDPRSFKAALELQIRKYLDRNGQKDATLQEMLKGLWYMKYLCAYIKNGDKPIRVEDVDKLLA